MTNQISLTGLSRHLQYEFSFGGILFEVAPEMVLSVFGLFVQAHFS
jgi:hypothetical protein